MDFRISETISFHEVIGRILPFLRAFEVVISCPTIVQMEIWVGKLMTSRRGLLETFPLALTGLNSSSGNFFFYTFSLAFKFLHKEMSSSNTSSECSYNSEDSDIFLFRITTWRSKTGSS